MEMSDESCLGGPLGLFLSPRLRRLEAGTADSPHAFLSVLTDGHAGWRPCCSSGSPGSVLQQGVCTVNASALLRAGASSSFRSQLQSPFREASPPTEPPGAPSPCLYYSILLTSLHQSLAEMTPLFAFSPALRMGTWSHRVPCA